MGTVQGSGINALLQHNVCFCLLNPSWIFALEFFVLNSCSNGREMRRWRGTSANRKVKLLSTARSTHKINRSSFTRKSKRRMRMRRKRMRTTMNREEYIGWTFGLQTMRHPRNVVFGDLFWNSWREKLLRLLPAGFSGMYGVFHKPMGTEAIHMFKWYSCYIFLYISSHERQSL